MDDDGGLWRSDVDASRHPVVMDGWMGRLMANGAPIAKVLYLTLSSDGCRVDPCPGIKPPTFRSHMMPLDSPVRYITNPLAAPLSI